MRARVIIRISGNAKLWFILLLLTPPSFKLSSPPGLLHVYVFTGEDTFLFCQASIGFLIFHSFQHYCCEGGYLTVRHFSEAHWCKIRAKGLKSVAFLHLRVTTSNYSPQCLTDLVTQDHLVLTFISLLLC